MTDVASSRSLSLSLSTVTAVGASEGVGDLTWEGVVAESHLTSRRHAWPLFQNPARRIPRRSRPPSAGLAALALSAGHRPPPPSLVAVVGWLREPWTPATQRAQPHVPWPGLRDQGATLSGVIPHPTLQGAPALGCFGTRPARLVLSSFSWAALPTSSELSGPRRAGLRGRLRS